MTDNTNSQAPTDSTETQTLKDPDTTPLVQHPSPDTPPNQQTPPLELVQDTPSSHRQEADSHTVSEPATSTQAQTPTPERSLIRFQQPPITAYANTESYAQIASSLCKLYADIMQLRKSELTQTTPIQDSTHVLEKITKPYIQTLSELAQTDWVTDTYGQIVIDSPAPETLNPPDQTQDTQTSQSKRYRVRSQLVRGLNIIGSHIESPPPDTPQIGTLKTVTRTATALTAGLTSPGDRPWSSSHQERPDIQPSAPTVSWPSSNTADDTPAFQPPTQLPERVIIQLCTQPVRDQLKTHSSPIHTTPVSEQNPYATLVAHTYIQAQYRELRQTHSPIPTAREDLFSFQLDPDQYSQTVLLHLLAETQKDSNTRIR